MEAKVLGRGQGEIDMPEGRPRKAVIQVQEGFACRVRHRGRDVGLLVGRDMGEGPSGIQPGTEGRQARPRAGRAVLALQAGEPHIHIAKHNVGGRDGGEQGGHSVFRHRRRQVESCEHAASSGDGNGFPQRRDLDAEDERGGVSGSQKGDTSRVTAVLRISIIDGSEIERSGSGGKEVFER